MDFNLSQFGITLNICLTHFIKKFVLLYGEKIRTKLLLICYTIFLSAIIYYYAKMQHITSKIQYKSTHKTHIYTPNYLAEKNLATITCNVNKMCPHTILNNMCTEVDRWYMISR